MKVILITWRDVYFQVTRTTQRALTDRFSECWLEGYLAGITEMINFKGGYITHIEMKEVPCVNSQGPST